jgi:hypothetical protein
VDPHNNLAGQRAGTTRKGKFMDIFKAGDVVKVGAARPKPGKVSNGQDQGEARPGMLGQVETVDGAGALVLVVRVVPSGAGHLLRDAGVRVVKPAERYWVEASRLRLVDPDELKAGPPPEPAPPAIPSERAWDASELLARAAHAIKQQVNPGKGLRLDLAAAIRAQVEEAAALLDPET